MTSNSSGSSSYSDSASEDGRVKCQIYGRLGHEALDCWKRFNRAYQSTKGPSALTALQITDVTDHSGAEWFPDTGATAHITASPQNLQHSQSYLGSNTVMVGDGNYLPITHIGSTQLPSTSGTLPLTDVLVCPNIAKSLLSVSKLTSDYPCSFEFDCDGVIVKDKATKKVLTLGRNNAGLYALEDPKVCVYYSSRQQSASGEVWDRRLGHPNHQVLQHLSANKAISISKSMKKICEACNLGKSSRLPFSPSSFVAKRVLERIHCDLWGPAPVMSGQGFRFYVIFIDNWSHFSWLYPLKNKSDFTAVFMKFQTLVEN